MFRRRARAKVLSLPVAVTLAELRTPLERSYRNTAYCGDVVVQKDGKARQQYCGNRWCLLCSRVKAARSMDRYAPVIESWVEPHMVTLTIPNVPGERLAATLDEMREALLLCRKAMTRTRKVKLVGVWKLECTYNVRRDDYHPHMHIACASREQAELLRVEWLKRHPAAAEKAQDVRACKGDALREMFKYFTKLVTPTRGKDGRGMMPPHALDTIFQALKGKRTYSPVGFVLPNGKDEERDIDDGTGTVSPAIRAGGESVRWKWSQRMADWIDYETGEVLADYDPSDYYRRFVDRIAPPEACEVEDERP